MLQVSGLFCERGDRQLLNGLSFTLKPGQLLHVRGANGAGKTSLLRIIAGLLLPTAGDVLWQGKPTKQQREDYHGDLLYLGHLDGVKGDLSCIENLRIDNELLGAEISEASMMAALEKLGLRGFEEVFAKQLSQGQHRRVGLCRLLMSQAKLWVLDEPFNALDVKAVGLLAGLIEVHLERGGMALLTTHQDVPLSTERVSEITLGQV
ncbi:cytochrome c biogenesis heme-transporting ATPase CcmA [Gammaproteobacteria bacterium AH-315-C21]|nr:cytochrome c biogenesis heme-transporting ATPase CcmA [Gammaproteobacteria bacterium AH-315-C21]